MHTIVENLSGMEPLPLVSWLEIEERLKTPKGGSEGVSSFRRGKRVG
ncbi:hypothetical protein ABER75_24185 [Niallia taxi]